MLYNILNDLLHKFWWHVLIWKKRKICSSLLFCFFVLLANLDVCTYSSSLSSFLSVIDTLNAFSISPSVYYVFLFYLLFSEFLSVWHLFTLILSVPAWNSYWLKFILFCPSLLINLFSGCLSLSISFISFYSTNPSLNVSFSPIESERLLYFPHLRVCLNFRLLLPSSRHLSVYPSFSLTHLLSCSIFHWFHPFLPVASFLHLFNLYFCHFVRLFILFLLFSLRF